jgi:hypothetical protein
LHEECRTELHASISLLTGENGAAGRCKPKTYIEGVFPMLAEKFMLVIEALRRQAYQDGSPRVVSTSPHVPVKLPSDK